jgi:hypothetical protein
MRDAAMCVRIYTGFEDGEISLRYTNGSGQRAGYYYPPQIYGDG